MADTDKVKITCTHCQSSFLVPGPAEGKKFRCPKCKEIFGVVAESRQTTVTRRKQTRVREAEEPPPAEDRKPTRRELAAQKQQEAKEARAKRMKVILPIVIGVVVLGAGLGGWQVWKGIKADEDAAAAKAARKKADAKVEKIFDDVAACFKSKSYREAIDALDPAIASESSRRYEAQVMRARAKCGLRDFKGALEDLDAALKADPKQEANWQAEYYRGAALVALRRETEAVEALDRATRAPQSPGEANSFAGALHDLDVEKRKVFNALEKNAPLVPACSADAPPLDPGSFDVWLACDRFDRPGFLLAGTLEATPIVESYKPDDFPVALVAMREDTPFGAALPGLRKLVEKGLTHVVLAAQSGGKLRGVTAELSDKDPGDSKVCPPAFARPSEAISAIESCARSKGKATLFLDPDTANEGALAAALLWLARHQGEDGSWSCDSFSDRCSGEKCSGGGQAMNTPGVTALATLAFLSAGIAPGDTKWAGFAKAAADGVAWVAKQQTPDGDLLLDQKDNRRVFQHAVGTLVLVQASRMQGGEKYKEAAQKAVAWLERASGDKGWGYVPVALQGDPMVNGWATVALAVGRAAGLTASDASFDKALKWMDTHTDQREFDVWYRDKEESPKYHGRNRFPTNAAHALTVRLLAAGDTKSNQAKGYGSLLGKALPQGGNKDTWDFYYWYVGTPAMYLLDGPGSGGETGMYWKAWSKAISAALAPTQIAGTDCSAGSWPNEGDPWLAHGGRVYATAINAMTLSLVTGHDALFKGVKLGK